MKFIISANTDIGLTKRVNQDSLTVMSLHTPLGKMAMAVICDGMGGHAKGELASACVIRAFRKWATQELPKLCEGSLSDVVIRKQWNGIVQAEAKKIKDYAGSLGVSMGTTLVAMLLTQTRYYIMSIGDSRAYEIDSEVRQITNDHSYVAREIALGRMTEAEAEVHPLRNGLLRGIGTSGELETEMFFGQVKPDAVYMLCTDGFWHEVSKKELHEKLNPQTLTDYETMERNSREIIELDKQRGETDNISVIVVKTTGDC